MNSEKKENSLTLNTNDNLVVAGGRAARRIEIHRHGPLAPTLFKLASPSIAGMLVIGIYNITDTFFRQSIT